MNRSKTSSTNQLAQVRALLVQHQQLLQDKDASLQLSLEECLLYFVMGSFNKQGWQEGQQKVHSLRIQHPRQPRIQAVEAGFLALKARYAPNPFDKWSSVNQALEKLDYLVKQHPDLLEARLVRYAIDYNLPALFGRSAKRNEDLRWILDAFPVSEKQMSSHLYGLFLDFVGRTQSIMTASQRSTFQHLVAKQAQHGPEAGVWA